MQVLKKSLSIILLSLISVLMLSACAPSNVNEAKSKMISAGYGVIDYAVDEVDKQQGVIEGIYATTGDNSIIALYFEDSKKAKNYAKSWHDSKYQVIGNSGKWAYAGTKEAVRVFKS